jgi:hypothetical protein
MRTSIIVLVAATLVAVTSLPAAAQNYQSTFRFQYWGAPLNFGNPAPPTASDSASAWGVGLRMDSRSSPYSFSARYDWSTVTPVNWPWNSAAFWDANVHYRFGQSLDTYFGVLAGWGGVNVGSAIAGQVGSGNGPRVGAEFLVRQPGGLYFTGEATYGFSWSTNLAGFPGTGPGNTTDLRAAVGYEFSQGWGVELGWRSLTWRIPTSAPGCPAAPGCEMQFSGVTAALTYRR